MCELSTSVANTSINNWPASATNNNIRLLLQKIASTMQMYLWHCNQTCIQKIVSNHVFVVAFKLNQIFVAFSTTAQSLSHCASIFSLNANSRDLILTLTSKFFWWLTILDDRTAWHLNENDYSMQIIGGLGQFIQTRVCLCKIHMPISHIQCNLVHEEKTHI